VFQAAAGRSDDNRSVLLALVSLIYDCSAMTVNIKIIVASFSWLCCYMAQMNPLIGPKLANTTLLLIAQQWVRKMTNSKKAANSIQS
jgi:hypothetical protein